MKKIAILLVFCLTLTSALPVLATEQEELFQILQETAAYVYETVPEPMVGSVGGEWAVIGLARGEQKIDKDYFARYAERVTAYTAEKEGVLHPYKYTEYARVVLALCAIGKDPTCVAGYDLIAPLLDTEKTAEQGIHGILWALIALDCNSFGDETIRQVYVQEILDKEMPHGGWSLVQEAEKADADVTAMALLALSPYKETEKVAEAIDRGLAALSKMQMENGGFVGFEQENSESTAQVLVALSALGISLEDARFVKGENTALSYLLTYRQENGGFAHLPQGETNLMATEQALYALGAVYRMETGQNALFDMTDVDFSTMEQVGISGKHRDVQKTEVRYPGKTFSDIENHPEREAIEALACRGIIQGMTETTYCSEQTVTRAEFAALAVRALGLSPMGGQTFQDVKESDWFYEAVHTAYAYGIVNGVSKTNFDPYGTITREEAACMVARASSLCGMETALTENGVQNVLAAFLDYKTVSDWAAASLAFCYGSGILDDSPMEIAPQQAVDRAEVASMLYGMLKKAVLL